MFFKSKKDKKKKIAKPRWWETQVKELKAFCGYMEKFYYKDIEMTVLSHDDIDALFSPFGIDIIHRPRLLCRYVDKVGVVRKCKFTYCEMMEMIETGDVKKGIAND